MSDSTFGSRDVGPGGGGMRRKVPLKLREGEERRERESVVAMARAGTGRAGHG